MHEVFPTQYNLRMGTASVKYEEEADTRIIVNELSETWKEGT